MTVKINTGLPGLDGVIQGLHPGDNVVWQVDEVKDYRDFLRPFVERSLKDKKKIIYLRFAEHKALLDLQQNDITVHKLNAARGFESFAVKIYNIIKREGEGAYYIFDCLSDLLLDWAADLMIANFFTVICPYLFELNTIAYFAIMRNMHSYKTIDKIQDITQVFLNLYSSQGEYFVYPVKVQDRHSSTMFLPHVKKGKEFEPIIDSYNVSKLFLQKTKKDKDPERNLDYWDKLFLQARVLQDNEVEKRKKMMNRICNYMLGRDQKIMSLVKNNFELGDVLEINSRLIGTGFIGGKTLGMLLARKILKNDCKFTEEECLEEHDSFYIGSDVFYSYIVQNGCWEQWVKQKSENDYSKTARGLKKKLLQGEFPEEIKAQFRDMLDYYGQSPIIVRSSSILEDGFGNAFAGKYDSYFCVNQGDPEKRYDRFEEVVRKIYASTMNKDAFIYRLERGLSGCDEQMALLVQRVSGGYHNHYFFPLAAGVGFSYNNYTWKRNMDPGEGMLRLVFGLGTRAVDRTADDYPRIVALDHVLLKTVSSREDERKFSQHSIDLLDLEENEFKTCSVSRVMSELSGVDNIKMIGEKDHETNKEIEKMGIKGREAWIISFDELLSATDFSRIIKSILNILENNYHYPVDIEFTVNVNNRGELRVNLLQCRPLQTHHEDRRVEIPDKIEQEDIFFKSRGNFMGGNFTRKVRKIVYVDPQNYYNLKQREKHDIARMVGELNRHLGKVVEEPFILIGPGRWGSSTPSLGIPVKFADINRAAVLMEVAFNPGNLIPELSFGTHFFQDLVEAEILYVALFPDKEGSIFNRRYLQKLTNMVDLLLTKGEKYKNVLRLYDLGNNELKIYSDIQAGEIIGF